MTDLLPTLSSKYFPNQHLQTVAAEGFWFPGRWIGAVSLILSPLLLLAATLLRLPFHFFFPQQLQAFDQYPIWMQTAYSLFLAGNLLLWPAILTLTHLIGKVKPAWAIWGGTMVMLGLFARTFHAGIDHMAFQLVDILHLQAATKVVASSYGAFHIVSALSACIYLWLDSISHWRLPVRNIWMGFLPGFSFHGSLDDRGAQREFLGFPTSNLWSLSGAATTGNSIAMGQT